jgi:hypothetical protein
MSRPLRLLNIALALVAVLVGGALAKTWVSPVTPVSVDRSVAKPSQEAVAVEFGRPSRPPLTQFDPVLEKNPFKQPPPPPPARLALVPPPAPLPTLSGTIQVGDDWRAIVNDKGKSQIYTIGQEVAGGVITEIKEDRIVFKRGDNTAEIPLKAAIETVASTTQPVLGMPSAQQPPGVGAAPALGQTGSPAQLDRQRRKQDKQAQKQERKSQQKKSGKGK